MQSPTPATLLLWSVQLLIAVAWPAVLNAQTKAVIQNYQAIVFSLYKGRQMQ